MFGFIRKKQLAKFEKALKDLERRRDNDTETFFRYIKEVQRRADVLESSNAALLNQIISYEKQLQVMKEVKADIVRETVADWMEGNFDNADAVNEWFSENFCLSDYTDMSDLVTSQDINDAVENSTWVEDTIDNKVEEHIGDVDEKLEELLKGKLGGLIDERLSHLVHKTTLATLMKKAADELLEE